MCVLFIQKVVKNTMLTFVERTLKKKLNLIGESTKEFKISRDYVEITILKENMLVKLDLERKLSKIIK